MELRANHSLPPRFPPPIVGEGIGGRDLCEGEENAAAFVYGHPVERYRGTTEKEKGRDNHLSRPGRELDTPSSIDPEVTCRMEGDAVSRRGLPCRRHTLPYHHLACLGVQVSLRPACQSRRRVHFAPFHRYQRDS
jgi:hypothetical protein